MAAPAALALVFALGALGNALHAHAGPRRWISLLVVGGALPVAFLLPPGDDLIVTLTALFSQLGLFRWLDFDADPRRHGPAFRAFAAGFAFDLREGSRVRPHVSANRLLRIAVHAALFASGLHLGLHLAPDAGAAAAPLRWTGGVLATYGMLDAASSTLALGAGLLGWSFPPMQRDPILSRSLAEFWGERWNRTVNRWLRRRVFVPFARRRQPGLGTALGFAASAALHAFMVLPRGGCRAASLIALYFVLQGCLVALERRAGRARGGGPLQRVGTVLAVVLPAPLLVDPILVAMGYVPAAVLPGFP